MKEPLASSLTCPTPLARLGHHHLTKVRDEPKCRDIRGEKKMKKESGKNNKDLIGNIIYVTYTSM